MRRWVGVLPKCLRPGWTTPRPRVICCRLNASQVYVCRCVTLTGIYNKRAPLVHSRSFKSASSPAAYGNVSSNPLIASSASRRYAYCLCHRPDIRGRLQSLITRAIFVATNASLVARRSMVARTGGAASRYPPTPTTSGCRLRPSASRVSQSGGGTQSSSVNAMISPVAARMPALRAAAGPL